MATTRAKARVQKLLGLRPVKIWVPDTRKSGFAAECQRQVLLAAASDRADPELQETLDANTAEIDGWTE